MSSSDQLAAIEPWMYRSPLADSWISEAFARDTDTLTRALQKSLTDGVNQSFSPYFIKPQQQSPVTTVSGGGCSGSDVETVIPKRRNNTTVSATGKITKRKSRASKRNTTTFITADPANFRQMVQQVTGVKFGNGVQMPVSNLPLLKPEPQRANFNSLHGCLPTLDTSAFLLDHHHNNQQFVGSGTSSTTIDQPATTVAGGGSGYEFDSFNNFPTLESWN